MTMDRDGCALLIVNADDYGYSKGVSRGILEAVGRGVVTATGILANDPFFDGQEVGLLRPERVDAGVHLNLTAGRPLTGRMAARLKRHGGRFPGNKFHLALRILARRIDLDAVEAEWDAQIRRCRDAKVRVWFLNSHEHIHMLPSLYRLVHRLADAHGVPFVRRVSAEATDWRHLASLPREAILHLLDRLNRNSSERISPLLVGTSRGGRIDLPYLERRLATMRRGAVYELMCHPGSPAPGEVTDPRLLAYHDWQGELNALFSAQRIGLFDSADVRLTRFRDLAAG